MRIHYLELQGFRGFRDKIRLDFGDSFTIIDGRNGVGKSTIFDAIEYCLTGMISKYRGAKASGESVENYLWWTGDGPEIDKKYVEILICDDREEYIVRRSEFEPPSTELMTKVQSAMCYMAYAPTDPLLQLCASSIIRDEHIASLSLDINESERYTLIHNALGAVEADEWVSRANELHTFAKNKTKDSEDSIHSAIKNVSDAAQRLDELQASIAHEAILQTTINLLQEYTGSLESGDRLSSLARQKLADDTRRLDSLNKLSSEILLLPSIDQEINKVRALKESTRIELETLDQIFRALPITERSETRSSDLAETAQTIVKLVELGRRVGLHNDQCPLCSKVQSEAEFNVGISKSLELSRELDREASEKALLELKRQNLESDISKTKTNLSNIDQQEVGLAEKKGSILKRMEEHGFSASPASGEFIKVMGQLEFSISEANQLLGIMDTLKLNRELEKATTKLAQNNKDLDVLQAQYSRALQAESRAKLIYDAARRARGESVDIRLDRVLPLLSELYKRLHPHPFWDDITHAVRGDVKRFLKLQVGDGLNPQFIFSSGQRRATGLAFLIAINMSLAWSRWKTLLLDDPVQHIDDFRSVHLAEVLAQVVREGKQVICSVEDEALADMLCRRLPVKTHKDASRISLHLNSNGALSKKVDTWLTPLTSTVFNYGPTEQVAH